MHLLNIQSGTLDDEGEAVDLGQTPADVVIISAADTELANIGNALDDAAHPSLRLANFLQLKHPMSVDNYIENTLQHAKIVILRLLGGKPYWPYGLEQIANICRLNNIKLCVLPGDAKPDEELRVNTNIDLPEMAEIWQYFTHGGLENAQNLLLYCGYLLGQNPKPSAAKLLMNAGIYWPKTPHIALNDMSELWPTAEQPIIAICFYRALLEADNIGPIDALIDALKRRGLKPLPIFVASLKDPISKEICATIFNQYKPQLILNATAFAVSGFEQNEIDENLRAHNILERPNCPILQVVLSGQSLEAWQDNIQGLTARDLAMNVALTEVDGRILTRAISHKSSGEYNKATQSYNICHKPLPDRVDFVADLASNWVRLKQATAAIRKVAIILANYPNKNARIGNGVGLDAPQSTIDMMQALAAQGYETSQIPATGNELIERLKLGTTNALSDDETGKANKGGETLKLSAYQDYFAQLPPKVQREISDRWGAPQNDPFCHGDTFHLPITIFGNVCVAIQPARGYNIDPKSSYHDPDLVPPHGYFAFYLWLRDAFAAHAFIHNGKHGNLEWLPGKALALSNSCYPEIALGSVPNIYPFIVNDPGEGTQAKRRTSAVILDHLTPPLTRAESYGVMKDLEALVDEYYAAAGMDTRRLTHIREQIFDLTRNSGLDQDCGMDEDDDETQALAKLDNHLCDLKELQIRDGLHIFGSSPKDLSDGAHWLETNLLVALMRVPRGLGKANDISLIRAISNDLGFEFDPLDCDMAAEWREPKPQILAKLLPADWRSQADTIERIEILAQKLVKGVITVPPNWPLTVPLLAYINQHVRPKLASCGAAEMGNLVAALNGEFIQPGPSGAPTRGRLDVLPTGKNFYSIDSRSLPTPSAWNLGQKSAENMLAIYAQTHGNYLKNIGISLWGTANMRTGGDDIAQAMALIGVKPIWDKMSWRVTGFEIIPLAKLNRPRVDVTMRISGFFRDAFPQQITLFDKAIRAVAKLDEDLNFNPIAANYNQEINQLCQNGLDEIEAEQQAGMRIFGSKPGAYGAGLQALIDENIWNEKADFAKAYLAWGSYAYGEKQQGERQEARFKARLRKTQVVVQNQDNREHDILDSDDYYQFEGGMAASIEHISGKEPVIYHNDHTRPERPVTRTLEQEIARTLRGRATNPKWLEGVMRHGYKGAFEMAATMDYLYAFAATTNAVKSHHFEAIYEAYIEDDKIFEFLQQNNPDALTDIINRLLDAQKKQFWKPRRNATYFELQKMLLEAT
ncbi:MAG: cobaltochelatase subunit CobN [Rhizobiales bacterium]|nr:cobaltochelatase subunit CobN [Hyphomicrobiales bacterium]NRB13599.1 cobaltochelatase subunit CobN [Hyphomicrobiales bacterium]